MLNLYKRIKTFICRRVYIELTVKCYITELMNIKYGMKKKRILKPKQR